MTHEFTPTETTDGTITVRLLNDSEPDEAVECTSYEEAIEVVQAHQYDVTAAKIVDRDDEVVFSSARADIDDWATIWRHEKARLGVDVPEHNCPYDDVACFADDLCVQCKIDSAQRGARTER